MTTTSRRNDGAYVHVWKPVPINKEEHEERDFLGIFDAAECPDCKALVKNGICLNACHLSGGSYRRFLQTMNHISKEDTHQ